MLPSLLEDPQGLYCGIQYNNTLSFTYKEEIVQAHVTKDWIVNLSFEEWAIDHLRYQLFENRVDDTACESNIFYHVIFFPS